VDFTNPLLGFAVGGRDSTIFLKTTDGGLNWIKKTLNISQTKVLNCVDFTDSNTGYIGSGRGGMATTSGIISKTTDGGETWEHLNFSAPVSIEDTILHIQRDLTFTDTQRGIRSIYFKDINNGYAVGGSYDGWKRWILKTTDAGANWQTEYYYKEQTGLLSVFVDNIGQGWAVGYYGVIYRTQDNGLSWSQILSGNVDIYAGDRIKTVFMINDSVGWAGGSRQGSNIYAMILKTTNGGKIWRTNFESTSSIFNYISDIFFLNENIGWAATDGNNGGVGLYKTNDGGQNWLKITAPDNKIEKIFFINQNIGWGVRLLGSAAGIYKSVDGGSTWVQKSSFRINSLHFTNIKMGWAVGPDGNILKSTNEGENWVLQASGTLANLNSVSFYDDKVGICVGSSGTVLLSTDGGENWINKNVSNSDELTTVQFVNSTSAWITSLNGNISYTTDLGDSWTIYNSITNNQLNTLYFVDEYAGWVGGDNGTLYKYQTDILPVELVSFTADVMDGKVQLNWQTATELSNYGFHVERKIGDIDWTNIGFVKGYGNSTSYQSYTFTDNYPLGGQKLHYRLKQLDIYGKYEYSNEVGVEIVPTKFKVFQNYPNPFNPTTKIKYQLPEESQVVIKIYDILGAEVTTLLNDKKGAGTYEVELSGENLPSGTYIYRIVAGNFVQTKKMLLLK
jgi:photosystem II stability/assembly factor-like uncharacterized protein